MNIHKGAEAGYRATWIKGMHGYYGTFVTLIPGRLCSIYTVTMSPQPQGLLMDNLTSVTLDTAAIA